MFIRTIDNVLVNLADKDVFIEDNERWDPFEHSVVAEGPHAGAAEEFFKGKRFILHSGTQEECEQYFDWLIGILKAEYNPGITRTSRPVEGPGPCPDCGGTEVHRYDCKFSIPF